MADHPCREEGLDEQSLELVLETVRSLGRGLVTPERCLQWDQDQALPAEVLRRLMGPDLGLHLAFLPADCGGLGGGARALYKISEALARLDLGLATSLLTTALGCDPLRVGGTDAQRRQWLGRVAQEGLVVAYAVTEPEAGSNVAALRTVAEPRRRDGRLVGYRLEGTKQFISNGGLADLYTVLARTPGGPSFFLVERGAPGLLAGPPERKHGIRCANTTTLTLDGLELPADRLVGLQEGQGLKQANAVFGYTRVMVAALGLGAGQEALERAVAYSQQRRQFGKLLCQHPGYTHKLLLPHAVRLEAARAHLEELSDRLDAGDPDLQTEGAVAKLFATEAGNAAADAALQALGGYGYMREYVVEKIRRDVRITTIYEGTSEIMQGIIYLHRLRQLVRGRGAFYERAAQQAERLGDPVAGGLVAAAARGLERLVLGLHRRKLGRRQPTQQALADRITELEHALAFCRRAAVAGPELQAACRLFAAETAARLAGTAARSLAAAGADADTTDDLRRQVGWDRLLQTPHGTHEEMDLVVAWLLER
jgi:alkylation response protein AidB-like acyl-CoA dehydrogenase